MLILVTFELVTGVDEEVIIKIPYIYYLVQFQESQEQIKVLLNSGNKVNAMNPDYT